MVLDQFQSVLNFYFHILGGKTDLIVKRSAWKERADTSLCKTHLQNCDWLGFEYFASKKSFSLYLIFCCVRPPLIITPNSRADTGKAFGLDLCIVWWFKMHFQWKASANNGMQLRSHRVEAYAAKQLQSFCRILQETCSILAATITEVPENRNGTRYF